MSKSSWTVWKLVTDGWHALSACRFFSPLLKCHLGAAAVVVVLFKIASFVYFFLISHYTHLPVVPLTYTCSSNSSSSSRSHWCNLVLVASAMTCQSLVLLHPPPPPPLTCQHPFSCCPWISIPHLPSQPGFVHTCAYSNVCSLFLQHRIQFQQITSWKLWATLSCTINAPNWFGAGRVFCPRPPNLYLFFLFPFFFVMFP